MEKIIKLTMTSDKDINICVNGEWVHCVSAQDRKINAHEIYDILAYNKGDTYAVETENTFNLDKKVLEFFEGLFKDIVCKLNKLK